MPNGIVAEQSPAELAAEEAAFAKGFDDTRGTPEPAPAADDAIVNDEVVAPIVEPVVEPAPAVATDAETPPEPAAPVTPPRLIAGLTEDQIGAALARNATLQGSVDKMAGRIGQLMQQIEALRATPPTTAAAQATLDLKLEKLSASFPELANLLREDLQGLQSAQAATPAPAAPAGMTQEQIDALLSERLGATTNQLNETIERKVLTIMHPDWLSVIKTPQFTLWRDSVLPAGEGKALMESEDSTFISDGLTKFKEWQKATTAPAPEPTPVPTPVAEVPAARKNRLANAVLPNGSATPTNVVETEEDAFAAGFRQERAKAGR